jgi:restriction endonuclease S subunit
VSKYQAYSEYKDSGVEWLGEVPVHWEVTRIKYHTNLFEQGWSPQCDSRSAIEDEYVNPQLASYFLSLPVVRQQIELDATGASHSMQNIGQSRIKELWIVLPPIEEAIKLISAIKSKIDTFDLALSRANDQIKLLQERRTALISAAVTGKIDVRNWQAPAPTNTDKNHNKEAAA